MSPTIRFPQFVGALNFRDMGGYRAQNGRHTRWNTLFRSGSTHEFTAQDVHQLASMGIRFAYGLRSNGERAEQPSAFLTIDEIQYHCLDHDRLPGNVSET